MANQLSFMHCQPMFLFFRIIASPTDHHSLDSLESSYRAFFSYSYPYFSHVKNKEFFLGSKKISYRKCSYSSNLTLYSSYSLSANRAVCTGSPSHHSIAAWTMPLRRWNTVLERQTALNFAQSTSRFIQLAVAMSDINTVIIGFERELGIVTQPALGPQERNGILADNH
jgi:hypothetical protein